MEFVKTEVNRAGHGGLQGFIAIGSSPRTKNYFTVLDMDQLSKFWKNLPVAKENFPKKRFFLTLGPKLSLGSFTSSSQTLVLS
jgi:hypothetical protein